MTMKLTIIYPEIHQNEVIEKIIFMFVIPFRSKPMVDVLLLRNDSCCESRLSMLGLAGELCNNCTVTTEINKFVQSGQSKANLIFHVW